MNAAQLKKYIAESKENLAYVNEQIEKIRAHVDTRDDVMFFKAEKIASAERLRDEIAEHLNGYETMLIGLIRREQQRRQALYEALLDCLVNAETDEERHIFNEMLNRLPELPKINA